MPREKLPVNPKVLEWARKRAGFTSEEATVRFGHFAAWEAGEDAPTYPQLERLAEDYGLPVAVFFFPEPPALPPIRDSFRTLPDAEFEKLPRRIAYLLRKAKAMQLNLYELCEGKIQPLA